MKVEARAETTLTVPELQDDAAAPAASAASSTPSVHGAGSPDVPWRTVGYSVGGVGAVGLVLGSIFGVLAFSKESDARARCPDTVCPTQDGVDRHDDARSSALISTIGFAAGAALVAAGGFLILTSKPASPSHGTSSRLRITVAGPRLEGTF
jgi:hypothetical protein